MSKQKIGGTFRRAPYPSSGASTNVSQEAMVPDVTKKVSRKYLNQESANFFFFFKGPYSSMIVRELKSKYFRLCGIYGVCRNSGLCQ